MKKVVLLVLLMPAMAYGQIVSNFENGNLNSWIQSPPDRWKADTVESISGIRSLHHTFDNPDSGSDQIGILIDTLHPAEGTVKWSFTIRHGYDPSSSNNWAVYILADCDPSSAITESDTRGYAVGVNMTGYDDTLRLWKVSGEEISPALNSGINWQSDIGSAEAVKIAVQRSADGKWTLSVYRLAGELIASSSGTDRELFSCKSLIISYKYSSSRDRLLWFDDVLIEGTFHKNIDVPPDYGKASTGDVVISEIMADPGPPISLPESEYIEIINRTTRTFDLTNWKLASADQKYLFPVTFIGPAETIIICSIKDTSEFRPYGRVTGMKQFPVLTDDGKMILLYDKDDKLIHGVEYSSSWYADELKSDGGWSLEMIDSGYPFYYRENWTVSRSPDGGTPGMRNSVSGTNPDTYFSGPLNVFPNDSFNITVTSPESLFGFVALTDSLEIDGKSPVAISLTDPLFRQFKIQLRDPLIKRKIYEFRTIAGISDFAGNRLQKDTYLFGLTEQATSGDILFNEILFNSFPGDPDYIELINNSDKVIDASRLELISVNDETGDTSQICQVSDEHRCILPGTYYAITTNRDKITDRYFSADPDYLFEINSLPSMPDDKGHLILLSRELVKIDELSYNEKMQDALLSGSEGVALERVTSVNNPGMNGSWHSASQSSGWGTPGARNSVSFEAAIPGEPLKLSSTRISPDNDGNEDFLMIQFNLTGINNIISVTIFDEWGNYVRKVAENLYAGSEASLIWDGTADDGSLVNTGVYIVYISMFSESGKTHKWKKVCTVVRR